MRELLTNRITWHSYLNWKTISPIIFCKKSLQNGVMRRMFNKQDYCRSNWQADDEVLKEVTSTRKRNETRCCHTAKKSGQKKKTI